MSCSGSRIANVKRGCLSFLHSGQISLIDHGSLSLDISSRGALDKYQWGQGMKEKTYLLSLTSKLTSILSHLPSVDIFLISTKVCLENSGQQCQEQECRLTKVQTTSCSYCYPPQGLSNKVGAPNSCHLLQICSGVLEVSSSGSILRAFATIFFVLFAASLGLSVNLSLRVDHTPLPFIQVLYYTPPSNHSRMEPDILLFFHFYSKAFLLPVSA